jgi:hypothetical protein
VGATSELPLSAGFVDDFRALVRSNARALFLYGHEDAEYASFRVAERTVFAAASGRRARALRRGGVAGARCTASSR